jgi:Flp pilus assembly protein TadG
LTIDNRNRAKLGEHPAKRGRHHRRRGSAAVELALILPLFVTIMLGGIDFARFAYAYVELSGAVRGGAAWAMMNKPTDLVNIPSTWQTNVQNRVSGEMFQEDYHATSKSSSLTVNPVTITSETNTYGTTYRFTVTASYPFTTLVNWNFSMFGRTLGIPHSMTLSQTVTMRAIRWT